MLKFDPQWRFQAPPDGRYRMNQIPDEALVDFDQIIGQIATQGDRWELLEQFKGAFLRSTGRSHVWSSSEDWAETDLSRAMGAAAANAPLFLEAFYSACEAIAGQGLHVPAVEQINEICETHKIGYVVHPPDLLIRDSAATHSVSPPPRPASLAESAMELIEESWARSEQLLNGGRYRESVQETLWMLESVTTAFRDVQIAAGTVRGKYFNDIVHDLRKGAKGSTLEQVLRWTETLHGYLSAPKGGGVRHGMDLNEGIPVGQAEARLYCNLIRSYVGYLLAEHERLVVSK